MATRKVERRIKYEGELDLAFSREISGIPGGEHVRRCIQCGTCSGTCPLSIYMDYTPRRIIALTRAGFKNEVLNCFTIWLCSSCYSCTVECPRQIKITDLMYTLKQRAIKEKVYVKRFPIPVLAHEFFKGVQKRGRNTESWLMTRLFLRTNPFDLVRQSGLGMRLLLRGRISLLPESIRDKAGLRRLLNAIEECDKQRLRERETGQEAL